MLKVQDHLGGFLDESNGQSFKILSTSVMNVSNALSVTIRSCNNALKIHQTERMSLSHIVSQIRL